jgi:hypothetical protein
VRGLPELDTRSHRWKVALTPLAWLHEFIAVSINSGTASRS